MEGEFSSDNSHLKSDRTGDLTKRTGASVDPRLFEMAGWEMIESVPGNDLKTPDFDANSRRLKSSLRIRYEAEVSVIKRKLGDLEAIRGVLGISQRKMSQLLFVDPSAWTRWTKKGEDAPPHIYRMLTWYLALNDKYPALDVNFWLQTVTRSSESQIWDQSREDLSRVEQTVSALQAEVESLRAQSLKPVSIVNTHEKPRVLMGICIAFLSAALGAIVAWLFLSR